MSLPNYLAKIKSSGIYRFVWDKSEIAGNPAETLRLVVGYSEKGPFNTPVYIESESQFRAIYGNISKKLEKRGIYFHRLALQALTAGPILALNLKKFDQETVKGVAFDATEQILDANIKDIPVESIFDTTRFWVLEPSLLNDQFDKYISIASADSKENSNTIFVRGAVNPQMDVTIKEWYSTVNSNEGGVPDYLENYQDCKVSDFLAEVYVFRGKFTESIVTTSELRNYFDVDNDGTVKLKPYITNAFGEKIDVLDALASDENSSFLNKYVGILLPEFKDSTGTYISLDIVFNADYVTHKMIMSLNGQAVENGTIPVEKLITIGANNITYDDESQTLSAGRAFSSSELVITTATATLSGDDIEWTGDADPNLYVMALDAEGSQAGDSVVFTVTGNAAKLLIGAGIQVGNRFVADEAGKLVTLTKFNTAGSGASTELTIAFSGAPLQAEVDSTKYIYMFNKSLTIATANMEPIYLEGYTYEHAAPATNNQMGKCQWQNFIMSALTDYQGIRTALTNRKDSEYHYIVDTFEAFVESELHAKLAVIAKEKDNAVAILNFPSAQTFKTCEYASFTDAQGRFQVKYIKDGANKQKPYSADYVFSLVTEKDGASYVTYNTPCLFNDGPIKMYVPAAAMVSNTFMSKFTSRQPYYPSAGPTYGRLTADGLVGPDINYSRADLDILEPMGVNVTVFEPRKGTFINSNQTAKQTPVTALSKLNVRELVIYLQDEIEALLQNYQWEFNTPALRATIKSKADSICELVKNNGGIAEYLNVCDESNNTDDVINNEMLVLSTSIEPGMACGKMVQELTIYKHGGMSAIITQQ